MTLALPQPVFDRAVARGGTGLGGNRSAPFFHDGHPTCCCRFRAWRYISDCRLFDGEQASTCSSMVVGGAGVEVDVIGPVGALGDVLFDQALIVARAACTPMRPMNQQSLGHCPGRLLSLMLRRPPGRKERIATDSFFQPVDVCCQLFGSTKKRPGQLDRSWRF